MEGEHIIVSNAKYYKNYRDYDNYGSKEIDLHGLDSLEAASIIRSALFSFQEDKHLEELIFIVGKGTGALYFTLVDILEKENWNFIEEQNKARITVWKLNNISNN